MNEVLQTFGFDAPGETGETYGCSIAPSSAAAVFGPCSGPGQTHAVTLPFTGEWTLRVRATDSAGNVETDPATRTFNLVGSGGGGAVETPTPTPTPTVTATETASPSPTATATVEPSPTATATATPTPTAVPVLSTRARLKARRALRRRSVGATATCGPAACTGRVTGRLKPRRAGARALGTVPVQLAAGQTLALRVKLGRRARAALRKAGRGTLTLTFTVDGAAAPVVAVVKLRP